MESDYPMVLIADEQPHALWTLAHLATSAGVSALMTADDAAQMDELMDDGLSFQTGSDPADSAAHRLAWAPGLAVSWENTPGAMPAMANSMARPMANLGAGMIVMLSATMPDLDMTRTCARWRQRWAGQPGQPSQPGQIWLMTPRASSLDLEAAREVGADRIFARPVDPDLIVRLIRDHASQWHTSRAEAC